MINFDNVCFVEEKKFGSRLWFIGESQHSIEVEQSAEEIAEGAKFGMFDATVV